MDLDMEQYVHLHFVERRDIHDVYKQLKEIGKSLAKWNWSGGNGLLTISREEADQKNAERLAEIEAERENGS